MTIWIFIYTNSNTNNFIHDGNTIIQINSCILRSLVNEEVKIWKWSIVGLKVYIY